MTLKFIGPLFGICGLILVGIHSNWYTSLGIFIMVWGNNIERSVTLNRKLRNLYDAVTKTKVEM